LPLGFENKEIRHEHVGVGAEEFFLDWSDCGGVYEPGSAGLNMLYGENGRWDGMEFQEDYVVRCRFGQLV